MNSNKNAFQKTFKLKVSNYIDFKSFQEILKEKGIVVSEGNDSATGTFIIFPFAILLILLTDFVLMLIIFYDLIKSFKQIGIEKMLGYDAGGIWSSRIVPIMTCEVCVFFVTALILSIVLFDEFNFLVCKFIGKYVLSCIILSVFTLIFVSIPFSYIKKIPVYATLKNKKPLKEMIIFNMFIKGIVVTTFLLVLSALYSQLALIKTQKRDAYNNWDKMQQYAYIYEECFTDGFFDDFSSENISKWKSIYQEFNAKGAILADFSLYSPLHIEEQNEALFPHCYDVMVNPNYLKTFPVIDKNGNIIEISEEDEDYIVLIPEKYEKNEAEILSYYSEREEMPGNKIKIIWMKQGQKLFSCALDIGSNDCNTITDPAVIVLTAKNGGGTDYARVAAYTGNPFKIRIENIDNLQIEINNVLEKYFELNDVWFPAVGVYAAIEEQITAINEKMLLYSLLLIILAFIAAAIIIQGIVAYFQQYQRILAIKKFLGYGFWDKFAGYFIAVFCCYIISALLTFIIGQKTYTFIFASALYLIEYLYSFIYIRMKEKKNIINVTKGAL